MSIAEIERELASLTPKKREKVILNGLFTINEEEAFRLFEDYFDMKDNVKELKNGDFVPWEKVCEHLDQKKRFPVKKR